jgi:hypothetical protein
MALSIKDPAFWRSRALEARAAAARMGDLLSRSAMVSLAVRYERLAARAATRRDIFETIGSAGLSGSRRN